MSAGDRLLGMGIGIAVTVASIATFILFVLRPLARRADEHGDILEGAREEKP